MMHDDKKEDGEQLGMQGRGKKTREVRLCVGWLGMGGVFGGLVEWMVWRVWICSDGT